MIHESDFCSSFCEIETKYKLFDVEFNGIKYWKHARYFVRHMILHKIYGIGNPFWFDYDRKNEWKLSKYIHGYQRVTDFVFHNINIGLKKDILLFSFNRRIKDGKNYVSPVTDEISLKLNRSHYTVESPYCGGYYRPTPIRGIKYYDVWKNVGEDDKLRIPINRGCFRKQILKFFENEFDIEFSNDEKRILLTNINFYIMYRNDLMKNYKKIIKKISPKVVLYTCAYIGDMVVLTEVLKEMNIPSIELLHGYITETDVTYNYSDIGLNNTLPDYIFVYSQIQKDLIKWGIPKENIRVVGWPWLEKKKNEVSENIGKQNRKKTLLFISCGNPVIAKYMKVLEKNLDCNQFEIIFKLHPTEYKVWKEKYPAIPDGIQVIDNNEHDIHFYLKKSDIVVGIASTVLYEAAIYPVLIYILAEGMHERMKIIIKSGRAKLVHDEIELLSCILNNPEKEYKEDFSFFAEHAIDNINNEIERIINDI